MTCSLYFFISLLFSDSGEAVHGPGEFHGSNSQLDVLCDASCAVKLLLHLMHLMHLHVLSGAEAPYSCWRISCWSFLRPGEANVFLVQLIVW